jgi:hypothetical protein
MSRCSSELERNGDEAMRIPLMKSAARLGSRGSIGIIAAALLTAGAVCGWSISTTLTTSAVAVETSHKDMTQELPHEEVKHGLIGSYAVTGTDSDGKPYVRDGIVDISLAPSGALELAWDNGKQVGVGQVIGGVLAVATSSNGRTAIWIMNINPDGSLSGKWSRRTDRGYRGTETWTRS